MSSSMRRKLFVEKVNKALQETAIGPKPSIPRFSTGIVDLDCAIGGGWPFGMVSLIVGEESTGKTLTAIKACQQVVQYDHNTHKHKDYVTTGFEPGAVLYVDAEAAFDINWAKKNGFDTDLCDVGTPSTGEKAFDMVVAAIHENIYDLIVIDSIATMIPQKEIEGSSEDGQMGLHPKLITRGLRRIVGSLAKASQDKPGGGPAIICLNQFRLQFGVLFGDPRIAPGGKMQRFASAAIIYTKGAKTEEDEKGSDSSMVKLGGSLKKNKTAPPKAEYSYELRLKDSDGYKTGDINNAEKMIEYAKTHKLMVKVKEGWKFGEVVVNTEKDMLARLKASPKLHRQMWISVVKAHTGYLL